MPSFCTAFYCRHFSDLLSGSASNSHRRVPCFSLSKTICLKNVHAKMKKESPMFVTLVRARSPLHSIPPRFLRSVPDVYGLRGGKRRRRLFVHHLLGREHLWRSQPRGFRRVAAGLKRALENEGRGSFSTREAANWDFACVYWNMHTNQPKQGEGGLAQPRELIYIRNY